MKLVIICVETNKKANTDPQYIYKTIYSYFQKSNDIKLKPIYLDSKNNYKDSRVLNEIKKDCNSPGFDSWEVVYCIDTDDYDTSKETEKLNSEIQEFCKIKGYHYVWFCRNIEDVYLGRTISSNEKIKEAKKFSRRTDLGKANTASLSATSLSPKKSNILTVFSNILQKK